MTGTALFAAAMGASFDGTDAVCSLSARHPIDWPSHGQTSIECAGVAGEISDMQNQISESDIKDSEVAVDQPANESTRHPAEIYTRCSG